MTIDEAANILNVKRAGIQAAEETELQKMLKVRLRSFCASETWHADPASLPPTEL